MTTEIKLEYRDFKNNVYLGTEWHCNGNKYATLNYELVKKVQARGCLKDKHQKDFIRHVGTIQF